jgi:photosystem II stability/assembly factor-like uncharacterized protein
MIRTGTVGLVGVCALVWGVSTLPAWVSNDGSAAIGPPGAWPFSIVAAPQAPGTVYAGLHGGGLLVSHDGGTTWSDRSEGLPDRTVMPVVVDRDNARVVYVGTHVGVFKSGDEGLSWSDASRGLANRDVWAIAQSTQSGVLLAATAGGGVYRSVDRGERWVPASTGITNPVVWPVAFDPSSDRIAYCGTFGGGLFRTVDGTNHWSRVATDQVDDRVYAIAVDASEPSLVYAGTARGISMSRDRGTTWRHLTLPVGDPLVFSITVDAGNVFAGTGDGVFASADRGRTWQALNDELTNRIVWPIAILGGPARRLMLGTLGGGLASSGSRGQWTTEPLGAHQVVFGVAVNRQSIIFAGTAGSGVMKTADAGKHWAEKNEGLRNHVVKAIALSTRSPETVFVAAQEQFLGAKGGVFRSRNGGNTWAPVGGTALARRMFTVSTAVDGRVYVGGDGGAIFRSTDDGDTWERIDHEALNEQTTGVTAIQQIMHPRPVYAVAVDARHADTVFATTDGGVFKTNDGGATWHAVNRGLTDLRLRALAMDPSDGQTVYVGAGDLSDLGRSGGVFKTIDGGETWQPAGLAGQWVLALAVDPMSPSTVYAGTDQGVLYSADGALTWRPLRTGGAARYVLAIALDPVQPGVVYAGTEGNSVLRIIARRQKSRPPSE